MSQTLQAVVEQIGPTTSRATVRTHTVLVDRPESRGGADQGPVGGEYLLVALGGCFTSHLLAAIRGRDAAVSNVRVTATGTLDDASPRFTAFTLDVAAECDDPATADRLIAIASRACQVVNTLRLAAPVGITFRGTPIDAAAGIAV